MKHTMLLVPAALAAGLFATPSQAHGGVTVGVGLPPVVIDTGAVEITIGGHQHAPPPPAPVVVHQPAPPAQVVYVREPPPPRSTVVVYGRERERVVYVDAHNGHCDHHGFARDVQVIHAGHRDGRHDGRGWDKHDNGKHKGWDKHGNGNGHGRGNGNGHGKNGKHRGYDR